MKTIRKAEAVLWFLLLGGLPAWANNAPRPDALISILIIFPVAILAFRYSGAHFTEGEGKRRLLRGLVLALCFLLTLAGTEIAAVPLIVVLGYGMMRALQILIRGDGRKRIVLGVVVGLWTAFAGLDYFASVEVASPVANNESSAILALRDLAAAEHSYAARANQKTATHGWYGTIEELRDEKLVDGTFPGPRKGYLYNILVREDGNHYFATAVPAVYAEGKEHPWWRPRMDAPSFFPLASLHWMTMNGNQRGVGRRSFAMDDSGVIRAADVGPVTTVSHDAAKGWKPLQ